MNPIKKVSLTIAGLVALALGGGAIANATSGGDTEKNDGPDAAVTGSAASKAGSAALAAVGSGKVVSVEGSDEGGSKYEVKVDSAGKITEVQLDKGFTVTSQKADDDQAESNDKGDGDGETNDDAQGHEDKGDGDGETNDG
jgi:hypothetical protein